MIIHLNSLKIEKKKDVAPRRAGMTGGLSSDAYLNSTLSHHMSF